jgi:ClpP class serine protease
MIDRGYGDFTGKVARGRAMELDYLLPLCGGRVWTGKDAVDNALADYEGGMNEALEYAAKQAGIESYQTYELPAVELGIEKYLKSFGVASAEAKTPDFLQNEALEELWFLAKNPGIQARLNPIFMNL